MNEAIAERLADALASRLTLVVPIGFVAQSKGGRLRFGTGSLMDIHIGVAEILDQEGDLPGLIETATYAVLNSVQDLVAEELTTPWPAEAHNLPMPGTRIVGDVLEMWYGHVDDPTARLIPLPLRQVVRG